ncbi:hypothetical protein MCUN1_003022 [Malassezia cuniculi]|uniref:Brix domain-containing protein n=1 Tax=Malassezia cuniculi TaxID=948313 RepID=A0AAF0J717_9BASI|nr:hypothetical protein MCUN1_003022 [Malassezia cuniculi]
MAKRRRKTRTHLQGPNRDKVERDRAPKSFVIRAGRIGKSAGSLVRDVRQVMEPNTASRLREREKNRLRDFLAMAGPLGVSHMLIFTQTRAGINMRILRAPRGPTVTFRVNKYALAGDIMRSSRRPATPGSEYTTPPMLVLNNFGGEDRHVKLLVTVFQNLFPPLHVHSMRLSQARRIVLLSYNAETRTIDWRHYLISVRPVGVSRSVRRIIEGTTRASSASAGSVTGRGADGQRRGRAMVNLANANDIADYVVRGSAAVAGEDTDNSEAESEAEDMADPQNAVELAQDYLGRGNAANTQRAVRLREIGPRMELRLVKIEEGLNGSEVLYHDYVHRTAQETAAQTRAAEERRRLAAERRAEQEKNVAEKQRKTKVSFAGVDDDGDDADGSDGYADGADGADGAEGDEDDDEFAYEDGVYDDADDGIDSDAELFDEGDDDGQDNLFDSESESEAEAEAEAQPVRRRPRRSK